MQQHDWYCLDVDAVMQEVGSATTGLADTQAQQRLQAQGTNELPEKNRRSLWVLLYSQFTDLMIVVLLLAALVSIMVGEVQDTVVILVIVLLNAIIGGVQEYRAENAVAALKRLAAPQAQVLRDGRRITLAASQLVTGDVVFLEAGNIVPADLRLFEVEQMLADESALSGESAAVDKQIATLTAGSRAIGDRNNLAFRGTLITSGRGTGVVVATGLDTQIGMIAALLGGEVRDKTPLQKRLASFTRFLALAVLVICALIFFAGLLQGQPLWLMFLTAVSLAVAAIPEALPAVVSISLALGAHKLIRHKALVRNLPAVETLGSVTYICSDKTGTLTQNRMTAEQFFYADERHTALPDRGPWDELGHALALNNDVTQSDGVASGEATELALFETAAQSGFIKTELQAQFPRVGVIAFDSTRKQMTTFHRCDTGVVGYVKGAPEKIIQQCVASLSPDDNASPIFDAAAITQQALKFAQEGYRVLAVAKRHWPQLPAPLDAEHCEQQLTFLGLIALIDPLRPQVQQAVSDCRSAGITPIMITGDHPGTAFAIAERLGIATDPQATLSGDALAAMDDSQFEQVVESVRVYARVTPEQKLRIVNALQQRGEFVAMTGDGVNDAPALKYANIGVSMGIKGTDVAREASDMVLLDDDFSTIVRAVKEGRRIFDNIRKFIKYTMSSNCGEIWTLVLAPLMGLPIPLLPIHILWINLVTDGLPGLALTAERAEPGIMQRPPRAPTENIFAHGMWQYILWVGLFIAAVSIAAMVWAMSRGAPHWQTMVFTVLTMSQLFHSLAIRCETSSLLSVGVFSNRPLIFTVVLTLLLQLAVIYVPALNEIFHTQPLPLLDLGVCLVLSLSVLVVVELVKALTLKRKHPRN